MKVTVTKKDASAPNSVFIITEFIKLEAALKLSGIAETGGMAKAMIQDECVKVNGQVCTMRGKKLYPQDIFECMGSKFLICRNGA